MLFERISRLHAWAVSRSGVKRGRHSTLHPTAVQLAEDLLMELRQSGKLRTPKYCCYCQALPKAVIPWWNQSIFWGPSCRAESLSAMGGFDVYLWVKCARAKCFLEHTQQSSALLLMCTSLPFAVGKQLVSIVSTSKANGQKEQELKVGLWLLMLQHQQEARGLGERALSPGPLASCSAVLCHKNAREREHAMATSVPCMPCSNGQVVDGLAHSPFLYHQQHHLRELGKADVCCS